MTKFLNLWIMKTVMSSDQITPRLEEYRGHWALITGASSGLGKEFAKQLACAGLNIVVVARRAELLHDLSRELTQCCGSQVIPLTLDLSEPSAVAQLRDELNKLQIRIRVLVNNVALADFGNFEESTFERKLKLLQVNVVLPVALIQLLFEDQQDTFPPAVINVTSPAALNPVPGLALYSATKAFILQLGQSLYAETQNRNGVVQTLIPGPLQTELGNESAKYYRGFGKLVSTQTVVRSSILGLLAKKPRVVTAKGTFFQRLLMLLFPLKMAVWILNKVLRPVLRQ